MATSRNKMNYSKTLPLTPNQKFDQLLSTEKKFNVAPAELDYYKDLPIRPGVGFFKSLIESRYPLQTFSLNIPAILCQRTILYTSKQGRLKVRDNVDVKYYLSKIGQQNNSTAEPLLIVQKMNTKSPWNEAEIIPTEREMKGRYSCGPSYLETFKKYIKAAGEHMQIYRLFYYAFRKAPIVIGYRNKTKYSDIDAELEARYAVHEDQVETVERFTHSGKSIETMVLEAKKICSLLSLAYGFRTTELVADFVKAKDGTYFLTNVKSFTLESTNYYLKVKEHLKLIESQAVLLGCLRETANDSTTCKLCGFRFNRSTEGRRVTAHTLLGLREHLKRRGTTLQINFKVRAEEFLSHTVTVCEICYDVAIAEHHLMEIEKDFAKALSIPIKAEVLELDVGNKVEDTKITKPVLPTSTLYMWRIMFYFDYFACSDDTHKVGEGYFFQFKFMKHVTTYSLGNSKKMNRLRVHYFFSATKDISQMLQCMQIVLRITKGECWDDGVMYEGKALMLADFYPDYMLCETAVLPKISYLFDTNKQTYVSIQATMGLTCDGKMDVEAYNLYKGENDVYFTDDSFYTSFPLPAAWIGIFASKDTRKSSGHCEEVTGYIPILSERTIVPKQPKKVIGQRLFKTIAQYTPATTKNDDANKTKGMFKRKIKELSNTVTIKGTINQTLAQSTKALIKSLTKDLEETEDEKPLVKQITIEPKWKDGFSTESTYDEKVEPKPQVQRKQKRKKVVQLRKDPYLSSLMFI